MLSALYNSSRLIIEDAINVMQASITQECSKSQLHMRGAVKNMMLTNWKEYEKFFCYISINNLEWTLDSMAEHIFGSGATINWGRIVAFVTICAIFGQKLSQKAHHEQLQQLPDTVTEILMMHTETWISNQPGEWKSFWEFCTAPNQSWDRRWAVLCFGGILIKMGKYVLWRL